MLVLQLIITTYGYYLINSAWFPRVLITTRQVLITTLGVPVTTLGVQVTTLRYTQGYLLVPSRGTGFSQCK